MAIAIVSVIGILALFRLPNKNKGDSQSDKFDVEKFTSELGKK